MAGEIASPGFLFGGNTGLTYEELKRRRAIAAALASRNKGFPKTMGEGLTYLGESIGEMIGDMRLREMERRQKAGDTASLTPPGAPAPQTVSQEPRPATIVPQTPPPSTPPATPPTPPPSSGGGGGVFPRPGSRRCRS